MKIFLSWSGIESKKLAWAFKEWLPNVLQYVEPYMSSKDIALGERWSNSIADNLDQSVFGLVFVTPSNIDAPWINFEAGALSKTYNSKVVPIIYKADVTLLNKGPLRQFQSTHKLDQESIFDLLESINDSCEEGKLGQERLKKAFDMWWEELDVAINAIEQADTDAETDTDGNQNSEPTEKDLLNAILSRMIDQERKLNKNSLNEELTRQMNNLMNEPAVPQTLIKQLKVSYNLLEECMRKLEGGPYPDEFFRELEVGLRNFDQSIFYLSRRSRMKKSNEITISDL